ncbi:MAG: glycosyl transferase [Halothece sp. Uz-M2-17]|nr:glycosyl transferase [Halothece sp. Uz-M2-17]
MSRPILYVAITSHGFGHAVRAASVAAAAQALLPELLPILVTKVPRWLLESYLSGEFIQRDRALDVGVVQSDSIQMDLEATRQELENIRANEDQIILEEAEFIATQGASLVLADIPHLAGKIAKTAGIPCWSITNFGWDFIYRDWGEDFHELADWVSEGYSDSDRAFRLPMYEPMTAFPNLKDVGLTGGVPKWDADVIREQFHLTKPQEKTVLLSFGGLGLQKIPYANLKYFTDWQFITFDRQAPDLPNLLKVTDHQYRPLDFMPVSGRVVSKPGYSTFSEALRVGLPVVSLRRERFAESPLLLKGIEDYAYHQILSPESFFEGSWSFLKESPQPPLCNDTVEKDGTEKIASAIAQYFSTPN